MCVKVIASQRWDVFLRHGRVAVACRLYTVDGVRVTSPGDLVFNGRYVAVGQCDAFQKLNYGTPKSAFTVTPLYKARCIIELNLTPSISHPENFTV